MGAGNFGGSSEPTHPTPGDDETTKLLTPELANRVTDDKLSDKLGVHRLTL